MRARASRGAQARSRGARERAQREEEPQQDGVEHVGGEQVRGRRECRRCRQPVEHRLAVRLEHRAESAHCQEAAWDAEQALPQRVRWRGDRLALGVARVRARVEVEEPALQGRRRAARRRAPRHLDHAERGESERCRAAEKAQLRVARERGAEPGVDAREEREGRGGDRRRDGQVHDRGHLRAREREHGRAHGGERDRAADHKRHGQTVHLERWRLQLAAIQEGDGGHLRRGVSRARLNCASAGGDDRVAAVATKSSRLRTDFAAEGRGGRPRSEPPTRDGSRTRHDGGRRR